jgi:hypothetical protein
MGFGTNYTGNKDATQAPSPAPAPRAIPKIYLPADADGATWANLQQQQKVDTDYLAHIQSAVGLDVPVINASGSGFTTPVNSGLGGTITPSGSAHIADGTRFVVQIQTGGAVGAATFKTSMDGGNTYGALQTTAASMTDATSGITLAFSGTFTANGTAAFRSAFTPQASWADQAGNVRGIIDHNGYRRGRLVEYYEDFLTASPGTSTVNGAASLTSGKLRYSLPATTNFQTIYSPAIPGTIPLNINIGSNAASSATVVFNSAMPIVSAQAFTSLVLEFEIIGGGASNVDWKIGLSSSLASATPNNANYDLALCKQAADTAWQLLTANGSTFTKTPSGVTASTTLGSPDVITLELHGSASPYGAKARLVVNNTVVETASTLPFGGGTAPMYFVIIGTTTSATNSAALWITPVRAVWNRQASLSPI